MFLVLCSPLQLEGPKTTRKLWSSLSLGFNFSFLDHMHVKQWARNNKFVDQCTLYAFFEIYAGLTNLLLPYMLEQRRLLPSRSQKRILKMGSSILPSQTSGRSLPTLLPTLQQRHMNLVSTILVCFFDKDDYALIGKGWLITQLFSCVGLASRRPRPKDLVKYAESCMYSPIYRNYR